MEEVGAPLLRASLHHTSRYSHFWACYTRASAIDNPEPGRPRLGAFLARRDVSLVTKVWVLTVLSEPMLETCDWLPDNVVLDVLEELFGYRGAVAELLAVRGMDNKDKAHLLLTGADFAATTIELMYAPPSVHWPVFGGSRDAQVLAQRRQSVNNAREWVAARRIRIRLKQSLVESLTRHTDVGLTSGHGLDKAFDLLEELIEKKDRTDIKLLMFAYMDHLAPRGTDMHDKHFLDLLGSMVAKLCCKMGGIETGTMSAPGGNTVEDARAWFASLLNACAEKACYSYFLQREWQLIGQAVAEYQPAARSQ